MRLYNSLIIKPNILQKASILAYATRHASIILDKQSLKYAIMQLVMRMTHPEVFESIVRYPAATVISGRVPSESEGGASHVCDYWHAGWIRPI